VCNLKNALFFTALLIILAAAFWYRTFRWKSVWVIFDIADGVHKAVHLRFRKRYKIEQKISDWIAKQSMAIDWSIRLAVIPRNIQHKTQIRLRSKGQAQWQPLGAFVDNAFENLKLEFPDTACLDPNGNEWIDHLIKTASKHESVLANEYLIELARSPNLAKLIAEHIIGRIKLARFESLDAAQTVGLCRLFGRGLPDPWFENSSQPKRSLFQLSMKMPIVESLLGLALMNDPEINWAVAIAIDKNLTVNDYDVLDYLFSRAADNSENRLIRILALDILRHSYRLDYSRRMVWPSLEWVDSLCFRISLISVDSDVEIQHAALKLGSFSASLRYSATTWQRVGQAP
jgi:hypothetical protein